MSKQIIESFIEDVWKKHSLDDIEKYISEDYVAFGLRNKITVNGVEGVKKNLVKVLEEYPDFVVEINDMFSDENKVVTRLKFKPSPTSDLSMREIIIHEIKDGKIYRAWSIGSDWN